MTKKKCIFLDRDGVLNKDHVDYTYRVEDFEILEKVPEALKMLKEAGYLLIIVTNQSGIAKKIYKKKDVMKCFEYLQSACDHIIDDQYFAPYHPNFDTNSLSRKPDSLMIEKAAAKYNVDLDQSWMIGDSERDMIAAKKVNLKTIYLPKGSARYNPDDKKNTSYADHMADNLYEASLMILKKN